MARTKHAGDRSDARDRQEPEPTQRDKGKGPAVRGETSSLPANVKQRMDDALTKGKIFIAERGIPNIQPGYMHTWLSSEVARLGWIQFCEPREPAVIPVVREFYARVPDHKEGKIRIRGKTVKFDADTINRLFALPVPEVDEYEEFAGSELTEMKAEAVCRVLTNGRGRWATYNGEYVSLKRNTLQGRAKVWFYYVVFSIMPVSHHNLCRRDPALLIYAIMENFKINVGNIIFKGILQSSEIMKGYWFPSLITMLCRQANVSISDKEETLHPGTVMTEHYVDKLRCLQSRRAALAAQRRERMREINDEGPSALAAPVEHEQHEEQAMPSMQAPADADNETLRLLHQIHKENRQARREFRLRHEQIDDNLRRNDENMRFHWSAAGYDMSHYRSMTSWADSSQAAQWSEYVEEEDDNNDQQESSAED